MRGMPGERVSVIMAAYNSGRFIELAIRSVLNQSYEDLELIIVDDGSTDDTAERIATFKDERILLISTSNQGVSAARNQGLQRMTGAYFCFLDSDDELPLNSIELRIDAMRANREVQFVDGALVRMDPSMEKEIQVQRPDFRGMPLSELMRMTGSCFSGATWLVRRKPGVQYRFKEGLTHAEDLLFFISIAQQGEYMAIPVVVYRYRTGHGSVMGNIEGNMAGFQTVHAELLRSFMPEYEADISAFKAKARSIIFRSFLKSGKFGKALRAFSMFS